MIDRLDQRPLSVFRNLWNFGERLVHPDWLAIFEDRICRLLQMTLRGFQRETGEVDTDYLQCFCRIIYSDSSLRRLIINVAPTS